MAAAFGLRVELFAGRGGLRGTAGAFANALALLGDAVLCVVRRFLFALRLSRRGAGVPRGWPARLDDRVSQPGRWDTSNVQFEDGRIVAYDKKNSEPREMQPYRLRLGRVPTRGFRRGPASGRSRPGGRISASLLRRGELAGVRSAASAFMKPARCEGIRELCGIPDAAANEHQAIQNEYIAEVSRRGQSGNRWAGSWSRSSAWRDLLAATRARAAARLFILGVGGSAANASHAVNDFRKIAGIEAYAPDRQRLRTDRPHQRRRLGQRSSRAGCASAGCGREDALLVFSVGGGNLEKERQPQFGAGPAIRQDRGSRTSWGSSAATAGSRPRWPTPA